MSEAKIGENENLVFYCAWGWCVIRYNRWIVRILWYISIILILICYENSYIICKLWFCFDHFLDKFDCISIHCFGIRF